MPSAICWPRSKKISPGLSSHPSSWNKPDIWDDSDQMVVSRHNSVLHDISNKPPTASMKLSVKESLIWDNPVFTLGIPVKINGLTNATHTLIFVWNNYRTIFDVQWLSQWALPTCFDLFYHPRINRHWHYSSSNP